MIGWALAILLPAAATVLGMLAGGLVDLSTVVVLFFLVTVIVALVGGLGPALLAAVTSGLAFNFFFVPPLYTLTIAEPRNVITVVAMLLVAVLVALVVDGAARRAEQAAQARTEAALLASFSRTVLTRVDPLPRLLEKVREAFGLTGVGLLEHVEGGAWVLVASSGVVPCSRPAEADVDVGVEEDLHLIGCGRSLPAADRTLLEAVGGQALLALRSERTAAEAERARRRAESTELRTALLSAVGHDLRTPLTSIKAAAGSLRDPDLKLSDADQRELAATVEESADKLTALVDNLLDSSRLATGAVTPHLRPVGYDEVVARALAGPDWDSDAVQVELDDELPEVLADAGLLERVVANVVDNALRHGGGAPVALRTSAHGDRVQLRVVDRGPGVPPDTLDMIFAPFQRLGDRDPSTGVGLGLSVARGFTEAMGGALTAEDTPGGGLTVAISLPVAGRPAQPPAEVMP
jgi:two-component system sensor histidine kinase KdpD